MNEHIRDKEEEIRKLSQEFIGRARRSTRTTSYLSLFLSLAAAAWLAFSLVQVNNLEERKLALSEEINELKKIQVDLLNDLGWNKEQIKTSKIETRDIQASLQASSARREAAVQSKPQLRENITIQVFSRDIDRNIVASSLRELGFRVEIKPPNPEIKRKTKTNAIWFGPFVQIDQVKLVAYTLIRAGVKLQVIEPFQQPRGRNRVIQIGSQVGGIMRSTPFSVNEIQTADSFG
ncbi:MAG: hypothetical protein ACFFCW_20795 [Candidatus Hodarchaeota archaeon]